MILIPNSILALMHEPPLNPDQREQPDGGLSQPVLLCRCRPLFLLFPIHIISAINVLLLALALPLQWGLCPHKWDPGAHRAEGCGLKRPHRQGGSGEIWAQEAASI